MISDVVLGDDQASPILFGNAKRPSTRKEVFMWKEEEKNFFIKNRTFIPNLTRPCHSNQSYN